jgi:uncharacterized membrane protein
MFSSFDFLTPLLNNPVPWGLSALILVFAFFMYLRFASKLEKILEDIRRAREAIKAFKEGTLDFAGLSTAFLATQCLNAPWKTLEKSLVIETDELDGSKTIIAPQNIGSHFNDVSILSSSINLRFYQALPNILVGVGLFFTFAGLVMALWFASQGVAAKDVEVAQAALKNLLDAATFKFLTSLAGLLSSLFFSYKEKAKLHMMAGQIELLVVEIESAIERRSLEQMAHQRTVEMVKQAALLREQLEEARQQTAQIKRFETDFAVSIASALDNRLSPRFEYLAATLSVAIENLGLKIGSVNEEALQTMIGDFRKTLTEGTSSEISKMAELVGELTAKLESSGNNLEEKLTGASNEVSETFKGIAKDLLSTGDGFKGIMQDAGQEMTQTFTAISGDLLASGKDMQEIIRSASNEVSGSFVKLSEGIHERGKDIQNMLRDAEKDMSSVFGLIAENLVHSGQQLTNSMQKAGEEITGSAKMLDGVLINLKADLIDLDGIVKQASESAEKTTSLLSRNVTDLSALHDSLGNTLQGLQGVGTTIENTTHSLSVAISSMTKAQHESTAQSKQLMDTAQAALGSIQASSQSITSVTSALQGAWESYQSRFEGVDKDLENVFSQIQMGLEQYADKVKEFQGSLDKHLSSAMQSLGALVQELSDSVEELHEAK